MLHLCHLFSGPPRVDGRWGLLRVLAMANSVAVSVAVCAPLRPPRCLPSAGVYPGGTAVLGHTGALLGPREISATRAANHHSPSHHVPAAMSHPRLDICS